MTIKNNQLAEDAAALRRQAEAKWSERKKKTGPLPAAEADNLRLVHELEVHQIELEMQNEELAQSRAEVEALLLQYADLYDFAPVGYFTLARDGEIRQANLAGARLLGVEVGKLIKRRFGVFVSVKSRPAFNAFLEKVFTSGSKETCEIELLKDASDLLSAHIEAICDVSRGKCETCHAVVSNITERKQAEEELRHLSTHDSLTGLYDRGFFMEEMARLERRREFPVSIVMADVDHLKEVNDQEGHADGDALLKRVAQALTAAFRVKDVVARIGGDEFAVLLLDTDAARAKVAMQRVRQVIQKNNAAHTEMPIRLSLGVSTAETPAPLSVVLKEADANMYREKRGDSDT
jgi:diguanylate cyclase (GGDEF)-like protein/PAS domain S-box-containing protein